MNNIKYFMTLCAVLLLCLLASCSRDDHESEFIPGNGNGILLPGIETNTPGTEVKDVHFFIFGSGDLLQSHSYFADPRQASLQATELPCAHYTVMAVLNVGHDFMPPSSRTDLPVISLADFTAWLADVASQYPAMLTGSAQAELADGEVKRVTIIVKSGAEGINLATLRLRLALPTPELPPYTRAATDGGYVLRCVADVYKAGTDERLHRRIARLITDNDGKQTLSLGLNPGSYDLRLWLDHVPQATTADYYYSTAEGLNTVRLATTPYRAGSDSKDAFYAYRAGVTLPADGTTLDIDVQRPLAKYRLVATDVRAYRSLMQTNGYPPLEELTVTVMYEGFFPSSFNVISGKPNDALTGISYGGLLPPTAETDTEIPIATDWVMVNGTESFVNATVRITDKDGRVLSQVGGVQIDYRRGNLTTVRGEFLTAGKSGGGIHIDTEWEDEYEVNF